MQVHQVERDSTLQIRVNLVHRHHLADIEDPAKRNVGFRDCFIDAFILRNPLLEIRDGFFFGHTGIIGITRRRLQRDIGSDGSRIVAVRFQEDEL